MHTCPVCGYDRLKRPPEDFLICPCCGTEFGYSDAGPKGAKFMHQLLREEWIRGGLRWHSITTVQPYLWNPSDQLIRAQMGDSLPWTHQLRVTFTGVTLTSTPTRTDKAVASPGQRVVAEQVS
jgi:hypothetical protein